MPMSGDAYSKYMDYNRTNVELKLVNALKYNENGSL